jgi:ribosomal protein L7/L12
MEQIILGALTLITIALFATISQMQNSIQYVHKRLDFITEQLGVENLIDEQELSAIHILLAEGKQNKAIKAYRQSTGVGLKEAYDAIQLIEKKRTSQ